MFKNEKFKYFSSLRPCLFRTLVKNMTNLLLSRNYKRLALLKKILIPETIFLSFFFFFAISYFSFYEGNSIMIVLMSLCFIKRTLR